MASSARWGGQAAFTAAKPGIKGSKIVNNLGRNIAIWLVIGVALMALFNLFQSPASTQSANKIAYSDFIASARNGGITEVLIEGNNLKGRTRENTTVISYMPDGADVVSMLADTDVRIDARPDESNMPAFFIGSDFLVPDVAIYRGVDFLYAPDAGRWPWRGNGLWQKPGQRC